MDVDALREEELNLLVGKMAELVAEDIMYADMVCISSAVKVAVSGSSRVDRRARCGGRSLRWLRGLTKGTQQ